MRSSSHYPIPRHASALLVGLMLSFYTPSHADHGGDWLEIPPPTRQDHTLMLDPLRNRLLLFGGREEGVLSSTVWEFPLSSGSGWALLEAAGTPPSARSNHTAIYDPVSDRMIVFGGHDGAPRNDLWALWLSGTPTWTALSPSGTVPGARASHTAVLDTGEKRMVVFGGTNGAPLGDVWALPLTGVMEWSALSPAGIPPGARQEHTAIYDPPRGRMLVFGGRGGSPMADVWSLSLNATPTWSEMVPAGTAPEPQEGGAALYDPVRDRMVVLGGRSGLGEATGGAAVLIGGAPQWAAGIPYAFDHAAVYDAAGDRALVHGGRDLEFFPCSNVTRAVPLAGGANTVLAGGGPVARSEATMTYEEISSQLILLGGFSYGGVDPGAIGGTDIYDMAGYDGTTGWGAGPSGPSPRGGHTAIQTYERMLVFGGDELYGGSPIKNDLWALDLNFGPPTFVWSQLSPLGTPPAPRANHSATFAHFDDVSRMLVFGGTNDPLYAFGGGPGAFNDVWQLMSWAPGETPVWTQLLPIGVPPSPRHGHSAVFDGWSRRMLVFGGRDGGTLFNDLWELRFPSVGPPTWTQLSPGGTPPSPRSDHAAFSPPYPYGAGMIVFGGTTPDVWALHVAPPWPSLEWVPLAVEGGPPAGSMSHAVAGFVSTATPRPLFRARSSADAGPFQFWTFGGAPSRSLWSLGYGHGPPGDVTPSTTGLALERVYPNPASFALNVRFALPNASPARLELFDLAGRRVHGREVGVLGPGRHLVKLNQRGELGSGLYLVRLVQGAHTLTAKVLIAR